MIGASKIDYESDDLQRLFAMINAGMNDSQIHREYRTNSNETISREHISKIRKRERWNMTNRSFIMKQELQDLPMIKTLYNGHSFKSEVAVLYSKSKEMYVFLDYIDDQLQYGGTLHFKPESPSIDEISVHHKNFIDNAISKRGKKNKN